MATAWIALGSDLGHRLHWLRRGLRLLAGARTLPEAVSSLYLTEPVGDPDLPWFHNAVARVRTSLSPPSLLDACLAAERRCGRQRDGRLAARALDLDVLLYDDEVLEAPGMVIPHPRMRERRFVLQPLAEIDAERVDPRSGLAIGRMLEDLPAGKGVWLLAPPAWAAGIVEANAPAGSRQPSR